MDFGGSEFEAFLFCLAASYFMGWYFIVPHLVSVLFVTFLIQRKKRKFKLYAITFLVSSITTFLFLVWKASDFHFLDFSEFLFWWLVFVLNVWFPALSYIVASTMYKALKPNKTLKPSEINTDAIEGHNQTSVRTIKAAWIFDFVCLALNVLIMALFLEYYEYGLIPKYLLVTSLGFYTSLFLLSLFMLRVHTTWAHRFQSVVLIFGCLNIFTLLPALIIFVMWQKEDVKAYYLCAHRKE